jgi:hypothetical protein
VSCRLPPPPRSGAYILRTRWPTTRTTLVLTGLDILGSQTWSYCRRLSPVYSGWELIISHVQWRFLLFDRQVGDHLCPPAASLTHFKGYDTFFPRPSREQPLGSPSPAYVWTESIDTLNWVGHLVAKHKANPDLLVYDYAVGGDDVDSLGDQVKGRFLPYAGRQPDWAPWKSDNTLFGTPKGP